jgi:hypothetical protein
VWDACEPATADQEYIERKRGLPDGLRVYRGPLKISGQVCAGSLVLPIRTLAGEVADLQFVILKANVVPGKPDKMLLPGVQVSRWPDACLTIGGPIKPKGMVYIVEGAGQAWSAHQATRRPAVCCFGVGRVEG